MGVLALTPGDVEAVGPVEDGAGARICRAVVSIAVGLVTLAYLVVRIWREVGSKQ